MEIQFKTVRQSQIADLMWEAETNEEVYKLINHFGHDAVVVYHMMVAATYDEVTDIELAEGILKDISSK